MLIHQEKREAFIDDFAQNASDSDFPAATLMSWDNVFEDSKSSLKISYANSHLIQRWFRLIKKQWKQFGESSLVIEKSNEIEGQVFGRECINLCLY